MEEAHNARAAFLQESVWHGPLDAAQAILSQHPGLAQGDIYAAAVLGEEAEIKRLLAQDSGAAVRPGGPHGWDALTYLCFSRYLRLDAARSGAFVRAATTLLQAGAPAQTGFWEPSHQPQPVWESALYGAAGVAHHAPLTRLLLEWGADPNDDEVPYHAAETYDLAVLQALLDEGKLNQDSLATLLLRKADWHHGEGMALLLRHGADPNRMTHWGYTALHQAVRRDNAIEMVQLLLQHGADPTLLDQRDHRSPQAMAARRGRADALAAFEQEGFAMALTGADLLLAACARADEAAISACLQRDPAAHGEVLAEGGTVLAEFAGNGNTGGVRRLLALGVPLGSLYEGDGYFGIARNSTALHVAAWRARHDTVRFLIDQGAPLDARDAEGRTALQLAIRACVDSYWRDRRRPDSVQALLQAGASTEGVTVPCGYAEVDALLRRQAS